MYFHGNETDIWFIESRFSGSDQQKVHIDANMSPSNYNKPVIR